MARAAKKEDRQDVDVKMPGVSFSLREFDYEDLDVVLERLQGVRTEHPGKKLKLRIEQEAYSDYEFYQVYERRPETDEEMAARQEKQAQQQALADARDLQELERLQRKFGKPGR